MFYWPRYLGFLLFSAGLPVAAATVFTAVVGWIPPFTSLRPMFEDMGFIDSTLDGWWFYTFVWVAVFALVSLLIFTWWRTPRVALISLYDRSGDPGWQRVLITLRGEGFKDEFSAKAAFWRDCERLLLGDTRESYDVWPYEREQDALEGKKETKRFWLTPGQEKDIHLFSVNKATGEVRCPKYVKGAILGVETLPHTRFVLSLSGEHATKRWIFELWRAGKQQIGVRVLGTFHQTKVRLNKDAYQKETSG